MRSVVKVTCDVCRKPVPMSNDPGVHNFAEVHMHTSGYGHLDGDHHEKWDVCSSECGLKLMKKYIKEIESCAS